MILALASLSLSLSVILFLYQEFPSPPLAETICLGPRSVPRAVSEAPIFFSHPEDNWSGPKEWIGGGGSLGERSKGESIQCREQATYDGGPVSSLLCPEEVTGRSCTEPEAFTTHPACCFLHHFLP